MIALLILGGIVAFVLLMALGALYSGWALSTLWGWFIVPLGLPDISILHAAGIITTVSILTGGYSHVSKTDLNKLNKSSLTEKEARNENYGNLIAILLAPALCVGIGWIYNHYM